MGIIPLPGGRTLIKHAYRRADGRASWVQETIDSRDKRAIAKSMLSLVESVEGSLTDYGYEALSKFYKEQRTAGGMESVFDRCEEEFGKRKIDKKFQGRFDAFVTKLLSENKSVNTVSNYKSVVQRVLRLAYDRGKIASMPIHSFEIRREFRNRVWVGDEQTRFWNKVFELDSHLQWALRLAEKRPIRKMDIAPLTTDNLVLAGHGAPYIRFRPKKTGKRKPRDTYLPLLDLSTKKPFDQVLFDYLVSGRPKDCPFLFPRIGTGKNGRRSILKKDCWKYLGNPHAHFDYLAEKAGIQNFHFHDLKHVAVTHMLKVERWTRDDLKDLGIQYSDKAIDVYLNLDAEDALERVSCRGFVADFQKDQEETPLCFKALA